jgi:hypothetical protein
MFPDCPTDTNFCTFPWADTWRLLRPGKTQSSHDANTGSNVCTRVEVHGADDRLHGGNHHTFFNFALAFVYKNESVDAQAKTLVVKMIFPGPLLQDRLDFLCNCRHHQYSRYHDRSGHYAYRDLRLCQSLGLKD